MTRARFYLCTTLVGLVLFALAQQVAAHSAVSNLGQASSGSVDVDFEIPPSGGDCCAPALGTEVAGPFVAGSPEQLTGVSLSMLNGFGGDDFSLQLLDDDGGLPGTFLLTFTGSNNPQPAGMYNYDAPVPFELAAGHQYWISATAFGDPSAGYFWSKTTSSASTGDSGWSIGRYASRQNADFGGDSFPGIWSQSSTSSVQFSVMTNAVPEPTSVSIAALVLGLVVTRRRHRIVKYKNSYRLITASRCRYSLQTGR